MDRMMQELISKGYLEKKIIKDKKGRFVKHELIVYEYPVTMVKPMSEWTEQDFSECPF